MAYRSRTAAKRHSRGNDGSFWLSFSDLMSSLVLIIVLVLFYIIYQYFNLAEINQAEIARRQFELDAAQTELVSRETELASAQAELEIQQTKLSDAEKQMIAQQILLEAKEEELQSAQEVLDSQEDQLRTAQSQLDEKEAQITSAQSQLDILSAQLTDKQTEIDAQETQLAAAQSQLEVQQNQLTAAQSQLVFQQDQLADAQSQLVLQQDQLADAQSLLTDQQNQLSAAQSRLSAQQTQLETQQTQLENQQAQIEQLVGMKTRIISSLSEAFRNSSISATVDPANGSIALESDVLFESAKYKLTERGQRFVDQVLPIYLKVLFSDEYRPYIAEIIIEGHTDSDGSWLDNLGLSQQRALAVANYALGSGCKALSNEAKNELKKVVTVNGRSFSDRIFNADGTENKDASRRVVFKFRLTDEEMIRQLQAILEAQ